MPTPRDLTGDPVSVLAVADDHDGLTPLVESLTTVVAPVDLTIDEDRALQILQRPEPRGSVRAGREPRDRVLWKNRQIASRIATVDDDDLRAGRGALRASPAA